MRSREYDTQYKELLASHERLRVVLTSIVGQSYKTDGTAYVISGMNMQEARTALALIPDMEE